MAPKATERVTSSAPTTTQTRDPFLEGFYSVEDKPETERKAYLRIYRGLGFRKSGETYGMVMGGPFGAFAGGVLGNVYASTDWESRIDAGFDYLKDRKKIKEYLND